MLNFQLPAHTASTSTTFRLWVIHDSKTASDQLGSKVDGRPVQEGHGYRVDEHVGWLLRRVHQMTGSVGFVRTTIEGEG
jgi:hypothetical protein